MTDQPRRTGLMPVDDGTFFVDAIESRPGDPDLDLLLSIAIKVLQASHVGDQNFINCLNVPAADDLRWALIRLNDLLEQKQ